MPHGISDTMSIKIEQWFDYNFILRSTDKEHTTTEVIKDTGVRLIPTFELEQRLIKILRNAKGFNENSVVDYKVEPHSKNYETELFKDILALANSYERLNEDRWLIYGVDEKTCVLVGVDQNNPNLLDDASYQQKFQKIRPALHIEFFTVPACHVDESLGSEKVFAAFYIPKECINEVYELGELVCDKEKKRGKHRMLPPSISFVRIGSSTDPLYEHHRLKIRELAESHAIQSFPTHKGHEREGLTKCVDVLMLLGSWDEANEADQELLATVSTESYSKAIKELQPLLDDGFFNMRGSHWVIADRAEGIKRAGKHLTKSMLLALAEPLGAILSSVDEAFDLQPDERIMVGVIGTSRGCSRALRKSVAIFCAQIGNNPDYLPQCEQNDIDRFLSEVMGTVFRADDWQVLASTEDYMPLLAEASPSMYLRFVEQCSDTAAFKRFLQEKTGGPASTGLGWGLVHGIKIAAIAHDMLSRAIRVLVKISDKTNLAKNAIVDLLLPWYPSTVASVESKIGIGKYLSKQPSETAWQALLDLLPGKTTSTFGVVEPTYISHPEKPESILMSEYWEVSRAYCRQALEAACGNVERLLDIIKNIDCYKTAGLVDEFYDIVSAEAQALSADDRYKVWDQLSSYVEQCEKFSDAEWAPSDDILQKIKSLVAQLKPSDQFYFALRFCSVHDWDLVRDDESLTEGQKRVSQLRADAIRSLYKQRGVRIVQELAKKGAKGNVLGVALSLLGISAQDEQAICAFADSSDAEMLNLAHSYVRNSFLRNGWAWADSLEMDGWPKERIATFYSYLPLSRDAWSRAKKFLGDDDALYWSCASTYGSYKNLPDLSYCVERLLEVGRAADVLELLSREVNEGVNVSADLIKKTLGTLRIKTIGSMLSYYIQKLFEYLETVSCDDELFTLELQYSALLQNKQDLYLYRRMAEDPEAFLLVVSIAYSLGLTEEKNTRIPDNVRAALIFRVLNNLKLVPGYAANGVFEEHVFCEWIEGTRGKIEDSHALDCIDREIGRVLFYAKPGNDFVLPEVVAEFLESHEAALRGYELEAFNSRGVYIVDLTGAPEDKLADRYEQKAVSAEASGYLNIADTLRSIGRSYRDEAERNRKEKLWD